MTSYSVVWLPGLSCWCKTPSPPPPFSVEPIRANVTFPPFYCTSPNQQKTNHINMSPEAHFCFATALCGVFRTAPAAPSKLHAHTRLYCVMPLPGRRTCSQMHLHPLGPAISLLRRQRSGACRKIAADSGGLWHRRSGPKHLLIPSPWSLLLSTLSSSTGVPQGLLPLLRASRVKRLSAGCLCALTTHLLARCLHTSPSHKMQTPFALQVVLINFLFRRVLNVYVCVCACLSSLGVCLSVAQRSRTK